MAIFSDLSEYITWAEEGTYGDDTALTVTNTHGIMKSFTPNFNNNLVYIYGIGGGRTPLQTKAGVLEASFNQTFQMQNGAWLKHVLGSRSGSGTSISPYAYALANSPPTLTVEKAWNTPTTANTLRFLGSLCNRAAIRCEEKQPAMVTMDWIARTLKRGTTYQSITPSSDAVYMFLNGTLEIPQSSTLLEIPSVDLQMINNAENYYEIGSRLGRGVFKNNEFLGTIRARMIDGSSLQDALGGSTSPSTGTPAAKATLRLNFTDGTRYIYINYTNVRYDQWRGITEQGGLAENECPIRAESCSATEVVS